MRFSKGIAKERPILQRLKHNLFELTHYAFAELPENNLLNWFLMFFEGIQLTMIPFRRNVGPFLEGSFQDFATTDCGS